MVKRVSQVAILVVAALLAGCATAPAMHQVRNTRTYQLPYNQVWEDIVSFFASHNIQVKNIAKDSGVIYAEATSFDSSMADCGKPGLFVVVGHTANFNVFVRQVGGNVQVTVNTTFTETRRFENNVFHVTCNSYGTLENAVLNAVSPAGGA